MEEVVALVNFGLEAIADPARPESVDRRIKSDHVAARMADEKARHQEGSHDDSRRQVGWSKKVVNPMD